MKFRVVCQQTSSDGTESHYAWWSRKQTVALAGSIAIWIASMYDAWRKGLFASTLTHLLHFVRWWESVHHTGDIAEARPHRIHAAGLCAFSIQPASTPVRLHYQCARCRC